MNFIEIIAILWILHIRLFKCTEKEDLLSCEPPPLIDRASFSPKDVSEYTEGTVLTYSCDFGYVSNQAYSTIECVYDKISNTVQWTSTNLNCIPRSCGDPGTLDNGRVIGSIFTFPSNVTYQCNEGYELQGQFRRFCQITGEWNGRLPSCTKKRCNEPGQLNNGKVHFESVEYNSVARYECNDGFRLNGAQSRTCDSSGKWTDEIPTCTEQNCDYPVSPTNGKSSLSSEIPSVGSTVFYTCNEGFTLVGPIKSKCLVSGKWTFPPPKCHEICLVPEIPNGNLIYRRKYYGTYYEVKMELGSKIDDSQKIYLKCNDKYGIVGKESNKIEVSCTDGKWSVELECAELSCRNEPPTVPHATLRTKGNKAGTVLWFKCNHNYYKYQSGHIECKSGNWVGPAPICKDARCYVNEDTFSGLKMPSSHMYLNRTFFYASCEDGYDVSSHENGKVTCLQGSWIGAVPPCLPSNCKDPPPELKNGRIDSFSTSHGSRVQYACNQHYFLRELAAPLICHYGKWTGVVPECKNSLCYLDDLGISRKVGIDFSHSAPTFSEEHAEITCLEGYSLVDKPFCLDGVWKTSNGLPFCREKPCEVTDIPNGAFMFDRVVNTGVWSWETKYFKAHSSMNQKSKSSLYIACEEPYIFHGKNTSPHVKVTCEKGQWTPTPLCLKPGDKENDPMTLRPNIASPTSEILAIKKDPRTTEAFIETTTLEVGLELSISSLRNDSESSLPENSTCFCTYNIQDENLLAFSNNKLLSFGDKIKKDCTIKFSCKSFGFHRLVGIRELNCTNCSWHSSEFPSCVSPQPGDPIIHVSSDHRNGFEIGPAEKLIIPSKIDITIHCETAANHYPRISGPHGVLTQHYHHKYVNRIPFLYSSSEIKNITSNLSGMYTCRIPPIGRHFAFNLEIEDEKCPEIQEIDGVRIIYENERKLYSKAKFICRSEKMVTKGPSESICLSGGRWSTNISKCEMPIECPVLIETDGLTIYYSDNRLANSTASFHCVQPYRRNGIPLITCLSNGEWSGPVATCTVPSCSVDSLYTALPETVVPLGLENITTEVVSYETPIKLFCPEDNYHLIGNPIMTCGIDGKWIVDEVKCIPGCIVPTNFEQSTLIISPVKEVYKLGDFALFSCPPGQALTSDVERIMCLPNGWSEEFPKCYDVVV